MKTISAGATELQYLIAKNMTPIERGSYLAKGLDKISSLAEDAGSMGISSIMLVVYCDVDYFKKSAERGVTVIGYMTLEAIIDDSVAEFLEEISRGEVPEFFREEPSHWWSILALSQSLPYPDMKTKKKGYQPRWHGVPKEILDKLSQDQ